MTPASYRRLAEHCRLIANCDPPLSPSLYAGALLHAAETLEAWSHGEEPYREPVRQPLLSGLRLFGSPSRIA